MRVTVIRTLVEEIDLEMMPFDGREELEAAVSEASRRPERDWLTVGLSYDTWCEDD